MHSNTRYFCCLLSSFCFLQYQNNYRIIGDGIAKNLLSNNLLGIKSEVAGGARNEGLVWCSVTLTLRVQQPETSNSVPVSLPSGEEEHLGGLVRLGCSPSGFSPVPHNLGSVPVGPEYL